MAVPLTRWKLTVHDYHQMAAAGILHEDDRVELIEGELLEMSPIGGSHMHCVNRLNAVMGRFIAEDAIVSVQNPIELSSRSEPQPDLVVLRRRDYGDELPIPADVMLVVEVSDSSLSYDRRVKLPLYGRSGIREVWIVDLNDRVVTRYTEPWEGGYGQAEPFDHGSRIVSTLSPTLTIEIDTQTLF